MTEFLEPAWRWVEFWSSLYNSLPSMVQEAPIWALGWLLGSLFVFGIVEATGERFGFNLEDNETFTAIGAVVCVGPALVTTTVVLLGLVLFLLPLVLVLAVGYSTFAFTLFLYGPYETTEFWGTYRELPVHKRAMLLALIPVMMLVARSFAKGLSDIEDDLVREGNGN